VRNVFRLSCARDKRIGVGRASEVRWLSGKPTGPGQPHRRTRRKSTLFWTGRLDILASDPRHHRLGKSRHSGLCYLGGQFLNPTSCSRSPPLLPGESSSRSISSLNAHRPVPAAGNAIDITLPSSCGEGREWREIYPNAFPTTVASRRPIGAKRNQTFELLSYRAATPPGAEKRARRFTAEATTTSTVPSFLDSASGSMLEE